MALIKSISGIRGTIGGKVGEGLTPVDVVKFTAAYGAWVLEKTNNPTIVIGRDARISGEMVSKLVTATLQGLGIDVIDLGLSTTPTVELAVPLEKAGGGIILTASHNPVQWNALKLLNDKGEFINDEEGKTVLDKAENDDFTFAEVRKLGSYTLIEDYLDRHVQHVLDLKLVDREAIAAKNFKVIIDCVNSTGGLALPKLLRALGVEVIEELYCEPNGDFPHNPEPLPEHLRDISNKIKNGQFDLGIVVDPDVDRLAFLSEDGVPFGEEYTLVAVADYVLSNTPGNTVSNLSSTRALRDVTEKHNGEYHAAAVGEVNVVNKMKETNAIIGGEGNGGVIYPESHYGRDALVGIGLFLTHLAKFDKPMTRLRASYPNYHISKNKIELTNEINVDEVLEQIKSKYQKQPINTIDGVKVEFEKEWVHLRKSNTEPIIRIYAESETQSTAEHLAHKIMYDIKEVITSK
ncbi:phosphoglucosamine mutase [Litoribacter populi]|uniref:phosphoglucosamine mutase n=1 Tax=Litoribacter populi TaxID=2598460 RepID=UPI0011807D95|nr:phosphoglucosamine mutase [Litoribacter populi]